MSQSTPAGAAAWRATTGADHAWHSLDEVSSQVPAALLPWLAEPGLLTARVRTACGATTRFRLLRLEPAALDPHVAARLRVTDDGCLVREIEFACGPSRWIFAQSVFPDSTVARYPWLRELGESPLGEVLRRVGAVEREPLEYRELPAGHGLARSAGADAGDRSLWARRAVYRLSGAPIIVQEVFLPMLSRCG